MGGQLIESQPGKPQQYITRNRSRIIEWDLTEDKFQRKQREIIAGENLKEQKPAWERCTAKANTQGAGGKHKTGQGEGLFLSL